MARNGLFKEWLVQRIILWSRYHVRLKHVEKPKRRQNETAHDGWWAGDQGDPAGELLKTMEWAVLDHSDQASAGKWQLHLQNADVESLMNKRGDLFIYAPVLARIPSPSGNISIDFHASGSVSAGFEARWQRIDTSRPPYFLTQLSSGLGGRPGYLTPALDRVYGVKIVDFGVPCMTQY
ncbi:hypothetical protein BDW67DRAFT_184267 [Aspergillus spinulosporus]